MSRSGSDDERAEGRNTARGHSRESPNYMELAKQSRGLDDYKHRLADRGISPETPKEWRKALIAWRALEASRQRALGRGRDVARQEASSREPADYSTIAQQFRHRSEYERYLVRELQLKPGTKEWEEASRDYDLKEHLDNQHRRPGRAPHRDPDERRAIEKAEDRLIQARLCLASTVYSR